MSVSFDSPDLQFAMALFMVRGAHGYKGFSEKVGDNLYKVDSIGFREAIENRIDPIDPSKVSSLSSGQIEVLSQTEAGKALIPLLNRMGELGMLDFREGLTNPDIINRVKNRLPNNSYALAVNAYQRSI